MCPILISQPYEVQALPALSDPIANVIAMLNMHGLAGPPRHSNVSSTGSTCIDNVMHQATSGALWASSSDCTARVLVL